METFWWSIIASLIGGFLSSFIDIISPFYVRNMIIIFLSKFCSIRKETDLEKIWIAHHENDVYPDKHGEKIIRLYQFGKHIAGKSVNPDKYHIKITGRIEYGIYLSGTFRDKKYTGDGQEYSIHYGTFQVAFDSDSGKMIGQWLGFNSKGERIIGHGKWEWKPYKECKSVGE